MVSETFHRLALYPAILALRGEWSTYRILRHLREHQWLSKRDVEARQRRNLAATVSYARKNCPWYADTLSSFPPSPADERILQAFGDIPFLEKQDLQSYPEQLTSQLRSGRFHYKTTGGSTGQPVTVAKDSRAIAAERAATWLGYGWFSIQMGDRGARFWGSPVEPGPRRRRFDLADFAMHRIRLSAFGVDDVRLADYWQQCLAFDPKYFYGYVSVLEVLARYINRVGLDGSLPRLKAIITTSESLSEPQRRLLEQTFDCSVQNEYGCGEVGPIAYECEAGSLHEMADNVYVELLRPDGSEAVIGEVGEVVVTDLRNRAMPLIRYRLADQAVRGEDCSCGRGLPVIASIRGRQYDQVYTPDGRAYHGEFFMYAMEDLRDEGFDIQRFRVIQEKSDVLRIEVQTLDDGVRAAVQQKLAPELRGLLITVETLISIPLSDSGKLRIIENRVDDLRESSLTRP